MKRSVLWYLIFKAVLHIHDRVGCERGYPLLCNLLEWVIQHALDAHHQELTQ